MSYVSRYLPNKKSFVSIAILTLIHLILVKLALTLVTPQENISIMWLPDGFLLATLVLTNIRMWPMLIISICFGTFIVETIETSRPYSMILGFLLANLVEAIIGAYAFIRLAGGKNGIHDFKQFTYFVIFCVFTIPAFSSFIGAYTVTFHFNEVDFWSVYRTWISSASLGILFVAPLIIILHRWYKLNLALNAIELAKFFAGLLAIAVVTLLASFLPTNGWFQGEYFAYSIMPLLCWVAIRFGLYGSVISSFMLVSILVFLTTLGIGPFFNSNLSISESVLKLQVYLGTLIITTMFVAISVDNLFLSKKNLERISNRFKSLFNKSPVSLWEEDFSEVKAYISNSLSNSNMSIERWFDTHPDEVAKCASLVNVIRVNDYTLKVFGAHSTPHLVSNLPNIFTAESLKVFKEEIIHLWNGATTFKAEAEQKRIDGTPVFTITSVILSAGYQNSWKRVLVSIEDITSRRENELKLSQAAAVYASTSEGVVVTDLKGNATSVNAAFSKITGYSEEEVIGKNLKLLKSDNHNRQFYNDMWTSIVNKGFWRDEIWNRRKDGSVFPELLTINAIYDESGTKTNYVAVFSDISKIKETEDKLYFLANHDPLTQLPNRLLFKDRFEQAIKNAFRNTKKVALIFIDIDRFKIINDSLGHTAGDSVLKQVANKLQQCVRSKDTVARVSGDEFVVLIEDFENVEVIAVVLDKIFNAFKDPLELGIAQNRVTVSAGVSIYPTDGHDMETLYRNADTAMYSAKEAGRNSYFYYTEELNATAMEYIEIENALHLALKQNELFLVYQPQVELNSGKLVGVETLIRWQHPTKGLIPPSIFVPIAERSGLISEIGIWVLEMACKQGKVWLDKNIDFGRIAVNASGQQLQMQTFSEKVEYIISKTGFSGDYLEIEVTETFVMKRIESSIEQLLNLKNQGIEISIDDFGTGYSSLSYLKQLPIDKLKIDQSFIKNIPEDFDDMAIVNAILAVASALNMTVIAEGVESDKHASALLKAGCHQAQGYLYSKPLVALDLETKLVKLLKNK